MGHFRDPKNPQRIRFRQSYCRAEGTLSLCTPWVLKSLRTVGDKTIRRSGPAIAARDLLTEWLIRERLEKKGPYRNIDLENLPSDSRYGGPAMGFSKSDDGRWHLNELVSHSYGEWGNRLVRWAVKNGVELSEIREIADALYEHGGFTARAFADMKRSTIWVPLDLRFSLEDQLKDVRGEASRLQKLVLRLAGRDGVLHQPDPDVLYRDIYCYLVNRKEGRSSTEIAREAFGGEEQISAAKKVRTAISRIRGALARRTKGA